MQKNAFSLAIVAFLLLLTACKDEDSICTTCPIPGTIKGTLMLVDSTGIAFDDYSGATVELEGTSYQTTSNSLGEWEIQNVPIGIYTIRFSKQGFGYQRHIGFQFVGNGSITLDYPFMIGIAPSYNVTLDSLVVTQTNTYIGVTSEYSIPDYSKTWIVVMSKDSVINPLDSSNFIYIYTGERPMPTSSLRESRFQSGNTYYAQAFGLGGYYEYPTGFTIQSPSAFYEPVSRQSIYTALGPGSNVVSFVMP
jgi:hypothetical protein